MPAQDPVGLAPTGTLPGGHPYVRAGKGPRRLVVFPGVDDAMWEGRYPVTAGAVVGCYYSAYLAAHAVLVVSRPRGLPDDYDVQAAAAAYARALEPLAPVDVVGISMGGLIGLRLAAEHPEIVDRLVIANSAHAIGDSARPEVRRLHRLAAERDWTAIRAALARAFFADGRRYWYPPVIKSIGRAALPRPAEPADVEISFAIILEDAGRQHLSAVEQPTLVIGGSADPYFTRERMEETATELTDGRLSVIPGARHGAYHERKGTFDRRVTAFLDEPRTTGSPGTAVSQR